MPKKKSIYKYKKNVLRKTLYYFAAVLFCAMGILFFMAYFSTTPEGIEAREYDLEDVQKQVVLTDRIHYDLDEMKRQNTDFAGWLFIPDTEINLPIVQGEDNSFYLTHGFTKVESVYGCPFLEYDVKKADQNKIIHGHNMGKNSDKIFSTLVNYQEKVYAEKHRYIYFSEPDVEGQIYEVFAVMNYDLSLLEKENYMRHNFGDDAAYDKFVAFLKNNGVYASETYTPDDTPLLILSTCNRQYGEDNRLLICAGKLKEEEKVIEAPNLSARLLLEQNH